MDYLKLNPKQTKFVKSEAKNILMIGDAGAGKTTAAMVKLLYLHRKYPGLKGLVGMYYRKKEMITIEEELHNTFLRGFVKSRNRDLGITMLKDGGVIYFTGLNPHEEEVHRQLANLELGYFWLEQAEQFPDATIFLKLHERLRQHNAPRVAFLTANFSGLPKNKDWLYLLFKNPETRLSNSEVIIARQEDNKSNLPDDYIEQLDFIISRLPQRLSIKAKGGDWGKTAGGGVFNIPEEVIRKVEIPKEHIQEKWVEYICAIDSHKSRPHYILKGAYDYVDDMLYIYEAFKIKGSVDEIVEIARIPNGQYIIDSLAKEIDPTTGYSFFDLLTERGLNPLDVADKRWNYGYWVTNMRLIYNKIVIDPVGCKELLDQNEEAEWDEEKDVIKGEHDYLDCLRYICARYPLQDENSNLLDADVIDYTGYRSFNNGIEVVDYKDLIRYYRNREDYYGRI